MPAKSEDIQQQKVDKAHSTGYRKDIDGLRAIAVLSVIVFHMGFLPNGYLGVDVFFAISGYLITKIVYQEALEGRFSIAQFYLRRTRRIIPLVLFTSLVAMALGLFVMLPDDFENLCQSVLATNVFANNLLLLFTTGNYWDIVNEFKPLMHTWSLGVEEQFYIFYPLVFMLLGGNRRDFIFPVLVVFSVVSLMLYLFVGSGASKFYLIQYRFFELSLGGLGAIVFKDKLLNGRFSLVYVAALLGILLFAYSLPPQVNLILVTLLSTLLLVSHNAENKWMTLLMENQVMSWLGKISFSLYMWHQIVLAFTRYFVTDTIGLLECVWLFALIVALSVASYFLVEQPFRNKQTVGTKTLLLTVGLSFAFICSAAYFFYSIAGVVRDVPELGLYKADQKQNTMGRKRNIHNAYNSKIHDLDKPFEAAPGIKVLIMGNSFARDFANVVLESKWGSNVSISYTFKLNDHKDFGQRVQQADIIFFSEMDKDELRSLAAEFNIDTNKVWNVGTKNFGSNNGIFYNQPKNDNYCKQRTHMRQGVLERNLKLNAEWGSRYVDLIALVVDEDNKMPVFTPDCKFISQDCSHLTEAGAKLFAGLVDFDAVFATLKPQQTTGE